MSANHTVRRTGSGDYACSCGQTWDYDEGCECPVATLVLQPYPQINAIDAEEWQCSHRGIEIPTSFLRKLSAAMDRQGSIDPEFLDCANVVRGLIADIPA